MKGEGRAAGKVGYVSDAFFCGGGKEPKKRKNKVFGKRAEKER
jgi:hypothetical protein